MNPTSFANSAGDGIVVADGFQTGAGVTAPKIVLTGTITFDPPSLTTGAFGNTTASPITITGVALGDSVELYPPYDTQGVIYQASPQAADKININLFNTNSVTKDLASGTWGYVVKRRV